MLIVELIREAPASVSPASYTAVVRINRDVIWRGRVEGHNRADGWPALLRQLADAAETTAAPHH